MGYLVEFSHKRWLFPGDTRTYESARLPFFGRVDGVFAHLWLGHGCALQEEPALIDSFCRFYLALRPGRVILTHLREFGRDPRDYWDETHSARTCLRFRQMAPGIPITPALLGESVLL